MISKGRLYAVCRGSSSPRFRYRTMHQMIRAHTMTPTISAAITEPVHRRRISSAWSVIPSGQPTRNNSLLRSHPVRVRPPRRPSAPTRASLLTRATARCLLVPRPDRPDGLLARVPTPRRPGGTRCPHVDHSVGRDYRTPLGGRPPPDPSVAGRGPAVTRAGPPSAPARGRGREHARSRPVGG